MGRFLIKKEMESKKELEHIKIIHALLKVIWKTSPDFDSSIRVE